MIGAAPAPLVIAQGLSAGKGEANAFSALSFEIRPASFTALVGANGSGKTTLFEVLLGLLPMRSGTLDVLGGPPRAARTRIAYVPQASRLVHDGQFVGREFVAAAYEGQRWGFGWNRCAAAEAVERALMAVGAEPLAGRKLSQLSGGQRQRLLIAQALINEPRLVFMDEPLAQLDPAAQDQIVGLAARLRDELNIAVLFSTHDVNPLLCVANHVLYLANGCGRMGSIDEVINDDVLSMLYGVPMQVVRERGALLVVRDLVRPPAATWAGAESAYRLPA